MAAQGNLLITPATNIKLAYLLFRSPDAMDLDLDAHAVILAAPRIGWDGLGIDQEPRFFGVRLTAAINALHRIGHGYERATRDDARDWLKGYKMTPKRRHFNGQYHWLWVGRLSQVK